jgi:flavin reductase (DIM6/NTAB) family NADH-FMN oxidoreductase RutF
MQRRNIMHGDLQHSTQLFGYLLMGMLGMAWLLPTGSGFSGEIPVSFESRFEVIEAKDITDNVFKLVGDDVTVITAGVAPKHKSMAASWGGFGVLFNKPTTWCFLRANRFTLEKIRETKTFTFSYFSSEHKDDVLFFGSKTGRDTDKMAESKLTPIATPDGFTAYAEARLVVECRLVEITTVKPDDFESAGGREFVKDGYADAGDYHKLVFGEIAKVWRKKP